jgi:hypothetical protein
MQKTDGQAGLRLTCSSDFCPGTRLLGPTSDTAFDDSIRRNMPFKKPLPLNCLRFRFARLIWPVLTSIISWGCSSSIRYETINDPSGLKALLGHPIAIVPVQFNSNAFRERVEMETLAMQRLLQRQRAAVTKELKQAGIVGINESAELDRLAGSISLIPSLDQAGRVREFAEGAKADGVLVMNCAFGFSDENGTTFDYASNAQLLNREGRVVWRFYGKAWALQSTSDGLNPTELLNKVGPFADKRVPAGFDSAMTAFVDNYATFLVWLIEQDFKGVSIKSSNTFPRNKRNREILILPATYDLPLDVLDVTLYRKSDR